MRLFLKDGIVYEVGDSQSTLLEEFEALVLSGEAQPLSYEQGLDLINPPPTQAQILTAEIADIDSQLQAIDTKSARPLRAVLVAGANALQEDIDFLTQYEAEASALRATRAIKQAELADLSLNTVLE